MVCSAPTDTERMYHAPTPRGPIPYTTPDDSCSGGRATYRDRYIPRSASGGATYRRGHFPDDGGLSRAQLVHALPASRQNPMPLPKTQARHASVRGGCERWLKCRQHAAGAREEGGRREGMHGLSRGGGAVVGRERPVGDDHLRQGGWGGVVRGVESWRRCCPTSVPYLGASLALEREKASSAASS